MYNKKRQTNSSWLLRQLRHDLAAGLLHVWPKFLPALLIFLIPAFELTSLVRSAAANGYLPGGAFTKDSGGRRGRNRCLTKKFGV
ncbi:MAG: hypothetical protein HFJ80_05190 [Clostridiales bacterium]|nr:hypothetical protein [Clostridiales bacterium]